MKKYTGFKRLVSGIVEVLVGYLTAVILCNVVYWISKSIFDYTIPSNYMILMVGITMVTAIIFYRKKKREASQALKEMKTNRP